MMGDDHGWEETGYNGHPHVKTPVLDEMAATALKLRALLRRASELLAHTREFPHRDGIRTAWAPSRPAGRFGRRRSPARTF
jgi:hypothetical protein